MEKIYATGEMLTVMREFETKREGENKDGETGCVSQKGAAVILLRGET